MATTPLPPRAPGPEWGTFTSTHFAKELARRNMGQFTESNRNTAGLNADLKARVAALEAKARLQASGAIPPSTQAALGKGGVGPGTSTPNPAQPATAPRPTANVPGTRPGIGIGGEVGIGLGAQLLYPLADSTVKAAGRTIGRTLGEVTGIKDSPEEFAAKPGWYKRWACFNAASAGVNDPRCEEAPPPQSASEVAGDSLVSYGQPPFTGGQGEGVGYRVSYQYNSKGPGGNLIEPPTQAAVAFPPIGCVGPIRKMEAVGPFGSQQLILFHGPGFESVVSNSSAPQGSWFNLKINSVERLDGQPDTAGNPQGDLIILPAERPQRSAPPAPSTPAFNPEPLPTAPAPTPVRQAPTPAPTPELEPTNPAPNRPPDRKVAPIPTPTPQQAIAPDGSPTGNPAPDATPDNVPVGGTATLPNGTTVTKTAGGYEVSVPLSDPRPLTSPRPVETPDGETIAPGETITEEKKEGGLPWWLAAPPVVAKIPQGSKVNAVDPSTFTNPDPPKTPPPSQPPTDNPCRCNAPITNRLDKLDEKLTKALGGVSAAGDAGILLYLQRMQAFAEKAWKATQMQKVLDVLTFIGVMHNVSMLSRNVGETFLEVVGQGIQAVGIRDEEDQVINVNEVVSSNVEGFLRNVLGSDRYDGINEAWNKANRIISSASAVIWTIRSISDASQDLMEWIGENTGKIGNSLKRYGVVGERSYPWMSENAKTQHRMRTRFSKITGALEATEDRISVYGQATSTVIELQEEIGEAEYNFGQLRESVVNGIPDPWADNNPVKTFFDDNKAASEAPDIDPASTQKG